MCLWLCIPCSLLREGSRKTSFPVAPERAEHRRLLAGAAEHPGDKLFWSLGASATGGVVSKRGQFCFLAGWRRWDPPGPNAEGQVSRLGPLRLRPSSHLGGKMCRNALSYIRARKSASLRTASGDTGSPGPQCPHREGRAVASLSELPLLPGSFIAILGLRGQDISEL